MQPAGVRTLIAGAGRAAQLIHLPHLIAERERFSVVGVADPAPTVRAELVARFGLDVPVVATLDELLELEADALICATPAPYHAETVRAALGAGLHVLCEKPLAFTVREHDELIAARDAAGRVVQVGYMKRFDPSYRRLLELLPADRDDVILIAAEVNDALDAPFTETLPPRPPELVQAVRELEAAQIRAELGGAMSDDAYRAYRHGYMSSLIHDVNLVHGIVGALGHELPARVVAGAFWAGGAAVSLAWELDGDARAEARHVRLPGVAHYRERITVLAASETLELTFPSPYLPRRPARLVERRSTGAKGLRTTDHHVAYDDAFRIQLLAFHAAVVDGGESVNTLEESRIDLLALQAAHEAAR